MEKLRKAVDEEEESDNEEGGPPKPRNKCAAGFGPPSLPLPLSAPSPLLSKSPVQAGCYSVIKNTASPRYPHDILDSRILYTPGAYC